MHFLDVFRNGMKEVKPEIKKQPCQPVDGRRDCFMAARSVDLPLKEGR
jgi:hypothetical protein